MFKTLSTDMANFLMSGDHVIRWQVLDQLTGGEKEDIHRARMMIELEGWGRQLLELQDENGIWGQSVIFNQYKSTLWVLIQFKRYGIYPLDQFYLPCEKIISELTFDGGIRWEGTEEKHVCLSGLALGVLSYFRYLPPQLEAIYHFLIETQREDGSWYCDYHKDEETARYATTLAVLEGLHEYKRIYREEFNRITDMQNAAHEFLLSRHLNKREPGVTSVFYTFGEFPFPYLRYDLLTVMDYFRHAGLRYDDRMSDAIKIIKETAIEGRWFMSSQQGEYHIEPEIPYQVSRFNTLRALRVLATYDQHRP
ncbi:MAG: hypothetical protein ACXAE3_08425 [Candidatus Kariarchaeaceae archaeon]|jgi:hypothetical protein